MKNLFQNKKILFTLILMISCLGILGVVGEGEAASCSDTFCRQGYSTDCKTADQWCIRGSFRNPTCSPLRECYFNYPFSCTEPQTLCLENSAASYQWICNSSWGGTCDCAELKQVATCDNQCCKDINSSYSCVNGKCQVSETCAGKGGVCCDLDENDCNNFISGVFSSCSGSNNYCCKTGSCTPKTITCISKGGVCCDLDENDCNNFISGVFSSCSGSNNYCCKTGSCVPKTTASCDCRYGNWQDSGKCGSDGGCPSDDQMFQTRIKNPTTTCGPNDCKDTTRCKRDNIKCPLETTTPAAVVPVIPQSTSTGSGVPTGGATQKPPSSGGAVRFTNPLSTNSFEALVMGIINWILGIVVSLAILFLIIGGLMYIVSAGDEEKIKRAKNIIMYAIIGLGVVILSWSIITELKDILGVK